jgi:membrane protein required for colicin V production
LNYLDIIIFAIIVIGFLLGFKDGLIRKIIGLLGLFVAFYVSFRFANSIGKLLLPIFNHEISLAEIFGGIILFFIVVLIFSVLKRIIHPLDKVNKLLNQVLGGVAGTIQVLFFISAVFLLLKMFNIPDKADKDKSLMYNKVSLIVPSSVRFVMGNNNSLQDYMQKIIQTNTSTIDK